MLLLLKTQAGAAQVDLVAGMKTFAARASAWHFEGTSVAKNPRAVFTRIVADAIIGGLAVQPHVRVPARDRGICLIGAFLEDHIVTADDALERIGQFRTAADVD